MAETGGDDYMAKRHNSALDHHNFFEKRRRTEVISQQPRVRKNISEFKEKLTSKSSIQNFSQISVEKMQHLFLRSKLSLEIPKDEK